jgi:outer membrane protein OmpU
MNIAKLFEARCMKKALLAIALSATTIGAADAEIALSGDAKLGFIPSPASARAAFVSRVHLSFALSRVTDSGLTFGTSIGITDSDRVPNGSAGAFYVSGPNGRLAVGDVEGAAAAAVGYVPGVGLISANDQNEVSYIANGGGGYRPGLFGRTSDPSALYRYKTGDLTLYASITQFGNARPHAYALGANYAVGDYAFALGLEHERTAAVDIAQIILSARAVFGPVTAKAIYGRVTTSASGFDAAQWAVSATYQADALAVTAYYTDDHALGLGKNTATAYGIGASYPIGGRASVIGGYYRNQTFDEDGVEIGLFVAF